MTTKPYKSEYTTLGIAMAGVYATCHNPLGDMACSVTIYDTKIEAYYGDLVEGGVVIDKRPCVDREDFVSMVVSGPMLKESLPSGHKEVFDFGYPRTLVACSAEDKFSGFDYIALDIYLGIWRKAGAQIGKRVGNEIHWEDGTTVPIPEASQRFNRKAA